MLNSHSRSRLPQFSLPPSVSCAGSQPMKRSLTNAPFRVIVQGPGPQQPLRRQTPTPPFRTGRPPITQLMLRPVRLLQAAKPPLPPATAHRPRPGHPHRPSMAVEEAGATKMAKLLRDLFCLRKYVVSYDFRSSMNLGQRKRGVWGPSSKSKCEAFTRTGHLHFCGSFSVEPHNSMSQ